MATITTLGFSIRSSYDPSGTRAATRSLITVGAVAQATTTRLNGTSAGMLNLTAAALSLAPALIPIGTAAAGVGAATVAMAVSSGSALGIYGAAMAGAIKRTQEMAAAGKALTPVQKSFIDSTNGMKVAWDKFIAGTQNQTLRAATTVVQGITSGIGRLKPVVDAVAPSIQKVADAFKNWMQGEGLQRFINDVIARGVPALNSLLNAGRDVLAVLGIGFRTFAGEGVKVAAALERGAAALRSWAEGGGFSRFLATVNQHAPQVREFFRALGDALKNIGVAMAGLGPLSLGLATGLLRIIAAMPPQLIQAIVVAFVAWRTAMLGLMIIQTIVTLCMTLRTAFLALRGAWMILSLAFASTPLGLIITGVVALVAGIVYLATQTRFFQTVWNAIWNGIRVAFDAVVNFLQSKWGLLALALGPLGWLLLMAANWKTVWNGIKTAAEAVWNAIRLAWTTFINAMATTWNAVSGALRIAWTTVWNAIKVAGEAVWNAIRASWQAVITALTTIWNVGSNAIRTAWTTAWNAIRTAGLAVWNALQTAASAFWNFLRNVFTTGLNAVRSVWQTVWNAVRTIAQTVWNAIRTFATSWWNAMRNLWTTMLNAIRTLWQNVWNAVRTIAQNVWNAIRTFATSWWNAMRNLWNTSLNAIKNLWQAAWNWVRDTGKRIWDAIKGLWTGFTNSVKDITSKFTDWMKDRLSGAWNSIKSTASKLWHEIGEIIEKAINAVIGIVNGLIGGFNKITSFLKIDVKISEIGKVNFNFANGGMVPVYPYAVGGIAGMPANFARGGTVSGYSPGRDTVPAMLSPGEGILTPEAVRGLGGPGFVHSANRTFAGHRGAGKGAAPLSKFTGSHDQVRQGSGAWGFATGGMVPVQHFAVGGLVSAALARAGGGFSITQGEYSNSVAASAGTHSGGGVVDIAAGPGDGPAKVARLRAAGFAAWLRTPAEGFAYHIHAVLMNHPDLSPQARSQVASYLAGGNGLAGGGADTGGGGIDILGMLKGNVGKILKNVYMGLEPLAKIGGAIADFFGAFTNDEDDGGLFGTGIGPDVGPDVAGAVGNVVGGVTGIGGDMMQMLGQAVLSILDKGSIAEGLSDADGKFKDFGGIAGGFGQIAVGMGKKLLDAVLPDFLMSKKSESTFNPADFAGGFGTGGTQQWAGLAAQALARAGLSASQLGRFLALMAAESGGNPMAINNYDSNAAMGQASRGLMQVIPSTFAAYRDPSLPNNIFDPLANMTAAARYIKARYGGSVPGSPYAMGTNSATRGWHLVGENGPEMRYFRGGERVANARQTQRELRRTGGGGTVFEKGAFQIDARGATVEAVREMETNLVPKLRLAVQAGVGKR
jgi:phage-related protein